MASMGTSSASAVGPRNIQFMLNRLSAYSKNTIRLQPQTKSGPYNPGDTIAFRLPASALLDLHTATLQFRVTYTDKRTVGATSVDDLGIACPPRYIAGFFKRVDIQMGSTSVGLTGLPDYGGLYTLLGHHTIHQDRAGMDLGWVENGGYLPFSNIDNTKYGGLPATTQGNVTALASASAQAGRTRYRLSAGQTRNDVYQLRSFLGLMGGQYMRFMDTNILPEVTVYYQIAPKQVVGSTSITNLDWQMNNVTLSFESVNFGDGTYRALVDRRLATSDIVIPFSNWTGFEGQQVSGGSSSITQFTVASKSLNGLIGTLRRGNYDAQPAADPQGSSGGGDNTFIKTCPQAKQISSPATKYYQFFCGRDPVGLSFAEADKGPRAAADNDKCLNYGWPAPIVGAQQMIDGQKLDIIDRPTDEVFDIYDWRGSATGATAFTPNKPNDTGANGGYPVPNYWLSQRKKSPAEDAAVKNSVMGSPVYQWTIDSKLMPQFNCDVFDAALLTKNYFDAGAMNMSYGSTIPSMRDFLNHAFMMPIGLDHHSDSAKSDNLVSGLDTRNSQIPITFTINNLPLSETVRPTVFANLTSMLIVGPDRIISTVL